MVKIKKFTGKMWKNAENDVYSNMDAKIESLNLKIIQEKFENT